MCHFVPWPAVIFSKLKTKSSWIAVYIHFYRWTWPTLQRHRNHRTKSACICLGRRCCSPWFFGTKTVKIEKRTYTWVSPDPRGKFHTWLVQSQETISRTKTTHRRRRSRRRAVTTDWLRIPVSLLSMAIHMCLLWFRSAREVIVFRM